jgi:membrane protein YdbS with pleckstrin-like domain
LPGPAGSDNFRPMPFPARLLVPGEELVLDLRPHPIALAGPATATLVDVIVGSYAIANVHNTTWRLVFLAVMALVLIGYPLPRFVHWMTSHFVLTSERVIHRSGFVAKSSVEIPLDKINDIRFHQGIFERIVGAGDLVIRSASEDGPTTFEDVRKPEAVQRRIYEVSEGGSHRTGAARGSGPGAGPSSTTELERLADLRARGVLTEAEFQAQKAKILGSS